MLPAAPSRHRLPDWCSSRDVCGSPIARSTSPAANEKLKIADDAARRRPCDTAASLTRRGCGWLRTDGGPRAAAANHNTCVHSDADMSAPLLCPPGTPPGRTRQPAHVREGPRASRQQPCCCRICPPMPKRHFRPQNSHGRSYWARTAKRYYARTGSERPQTDIGPKSRRHSWHAPPHLKCFASGADSNSRASPPPRALPRSRRCSPTDPGAREAYAANERRSRPVSPTAWSTRGDALILRVSITSKTSPHLAEALYRPAHPAEHPIRLHDRRLRALAGRRIAGAPSVCQLPTRNVLSYLMLWPQRSRAQARLPGERPPAWRRRATVSGTGAVAYMGPAVVTRLEICCNLTGLRLADRLPWLQPVEGWVPGYAM